MWQRRLHDQQAPRIRAGVVSFLVTLALGVASESPAQRTVHVRIADVMWADAVRRAQLLSRLREELNRPRVRFEVITSGPGGQRLCSRVRTDDSTRQASDSVRRAPPSRPNVYDLCVRVWQHDAELRAAVVVLDDGGRVAEWFEVTDDSDKDDPLVGAIVDRLIINLSKSVRIAILDFPMVGGDSNRFGSFRRSLPSMLATGLSLSRRVVLIEGIEMERLIDSTRRMQIGITNPYAALNLAKRLNANYYIMGQYLELKGELWIDVRCVSIESREVIVTRGIRIEEISLRAIEDRMRRLSAELRSAIEADFIERRNRPRYLALGALPPDPPNGESRKMLQHLVRTTTSKLRHYQRHDLRVRQSHDVLPRLTEASHDRWTMSQLLEADVLVTMTVDLTRRDEVIIKYDLFDQERPQESESFEAHGPATSVDSLLNVVVDTLHTRLGHSVTASSDSLATKDSAEARARRLSRDIKYRRPYPQLAGRVSLGIAQQRDTILLLGARAIGILEVGASWVPGSARWQYTPTVRLTFLASRASGAQRAFGADAFVSAVYNVRPYHAVSPFVGATVGLLGVARQGNGNFEYDAAWGVGALAGFEQSLGGTAKLFAKIEYARGLETIPSRDIDDQHFVSTRPEAFYVTFGSRFAF